MPRWRITPSQRIALGYAGLCLVGALLLLLPFSQKTHVSVVDAIFTSASALFVTGLSSVNTLHTFTPVGDLVIAALVQIGGIGITFLSTSFYLLLGRKLRLGDRRLLAEERNSSTRGIVRLFRRVVFFSFGIEGVAALMFTLYLHFRYGYTWAKAVGISCFHSISAFNNAGFDIWGNNLESFTRDPFMLLLTALLVILGGIGFVVLVELVRYPKQRRLSLHARIVLGMSALLLAVGTLLILAFEWNKSMANLSPGYKLLNAFFTSTVARTAGFDSVPIGNMQEVTWLILILLMFIGASPGSTGGGIKTTSLFLILKTVAANIRGRSQIVSGHRQIPWDLSQRSLLIALLSGGVVLVCTLVDAAFEPNIPIIKIIFEEVSAYGTVGLSTGITGIIGPEMKWVLILTMYIGRIGIFTFLMSLVQRSQSRVQYVEERIFIG
ncbi:TrkH family potassium uptake protein [Alicyclobacillus fastidiosus]|uniref:Potassium transporter TrkG n=1 Tax=Alicyclobacillus fastidiosus TaxID=392011 RepID=A0ABV5AJ11_9BACL|nr:potassium transporter TrkG [Alicyclobacillus fastidiosus]WEH09218.1 potassium transporter TrkG [Alicyclobacillus fastidiosus]